MSAKARFEELLGEKNKAMGSLSRSVSQEERDRLLQQIINISEKELKLVTEEAKKGNNMTEDIQHMEDALAAMQKAAERRNSKSPKKEAKSPDKQDDSRSSPRRRISFGKSPPKRRSRSRRGSRTKTRRKGKPIEIKLKKPSDNKTYRVKPHLKTYPSSQSNDSPATTVSPASDVGGSPSGAVTPSSPYLPPYPQTYPYGPQFSGFPNRDASVSPQPYDNIQDYITDDGTDHPGFSLWDWFKNALPSEQKNPFDVPRERRILEREKELQDLINNVLKVSEAVVETRNNMTSPYGEENCDASKRNAESKLKDLEKLGEKLRKEFGEPLRPTGGSYHNLPQTPSTAAKEELKKGKKAISKMLDVEHDVYDRGKPDDPAPRLSSPPSPGKGYRTPPSPPSPVQRPVSGSESSLSPGLFPPAKPSEQPGIGPSKSAPLYTQPAHEFPADKKSDDPKYKREPPDVKQRGSLDKGDKGKPRDDRFPDGGKRASFPEGGKRASFPDGGKRPSFHDGGKQTSFPDGEKRANFPDGKRRNSGDKSRPDRDKFKGYEIDGPRKKPGDRKRRPSDRKQDPRRDSKRGSPVKPWKGILSSKQGLSSPSSASDGCSCSCSNKPPVKNLPHFHTAPIGRLPFSQWTGFGPTSLDDSVMPSGQMTGPIEFPAQAVTAAMPYSQEPELVELPIVHLPSIRRLSKSKNKGDGKKSPARNGKKDLHLYDIQMNPGDFNVGHMAPNVPRMFQLKPLPPGPPLGGQFGQRPPFRNPIFKINAQSHKDLQKLPSQSAASPVSSDNLSAALTSLTSVPSMSRPMTVDDFYQAYHPVTGVEQLGQKPIHIPPKPARLTGNIDRNLSHSQTEMVVYFVVLLATVIGLWSVIAVYSRRGKDEFID